MLKLARSAEGHFVTLIEICLHLINFNPRHSKRITLYLRCFTFVFSSHSLDSYVPRLVS